MHIIFIFLLTFGGSTAAPPGPSLSHIKELVSIADEISNRPDNVYTCDSSNSENWFIYCSGKLLEAVNILSIYKDSKTFVDMPMKKTPKETLDAYSQRFGNKTAIEIKRDELIAFLNEYFTEPGTELEECEPSDWIPNPPKLMKITDETTRKFALDLHAIWKELCRKIKPTAGGIQSSLINLPYEFIVPGGRFREFYYWDAYWIVKGLVISEMLNTTKSMLLNLVHVVNTLGFIPNGGRVYYSQRSHPPFLIGMALEYFTETQDVQFLKSIMPALAKEYQFWERNRTVIVKGQDGKDYKVFIYRTNSNVPRPESYREDVTLALKVPPEKRPRLYQDLASAAESGWDFSSRWLRDKKTLQTIETTNFAQVDLNSIMCWNMGIMELFYKTIGNVEEAKRYSAKREDFRYAFHFVFYNESRKAWFDYNINTKKHETDFYASVATPLFGGCYQTLNLDKSQGLYKFMNESGAFNYPGGIPASMTNASGEQWDFPNGWSPLVHMIIEGLRKSEDPGMQEQAFQIAKEWVIRNYEVYKKTGHMWEKYVVTDELPSPGAGGEYDVQPGFGWTNGVMLHLLSNYPNRMTVTPGSQELLKGEKSSTAQKTDNDKSSISQRTSISVAMTTLCFIVMYVMM